MSRKKRRNLSGNVDATGRRKRDQRHVRIDHWIMRTPAWAALTPAEKAVYLELLAFFNGDNNGEIHLSRREAARRCNINKDTATKALRSLEEKGFIRRRATEPLHWSMGMADCFILTQHPFAGHFATKDFARWRPPPAPPKSPAGRK